MPSILPKERFLFLGKSEILKYPLIKTYFKRLNIPVFRKSPVKAAKSLIRAKQEVKKGWSLVIFPEGGIPDYHTPKMIEFKEGAFQLAKSCKVPIVPVTFTNNHLLFSDPSNTFGPARPGTSHVYVHPFISIDEVKSLSQMELSDKCFEIVNGPIKEQYPNLKD
jgi:1-acyl-sn-glycerol-3-phosphate acyltransferase